MAQISDENGNITTRQGDTFYIDLTEIDSSFVGGELYVQVINDKRKPMFENEPHKTVSDATERITIGASLSNLLTVKPSEDYAEYRYAVKCVKSGVEDTWLLGNTEDFGELPVITVYPKVVEGE